jgi:hypothetical protein
VMHALLPQIHMALVLHLAAVALSTCWAGIVPVFIRLLKTTKGDQCLIEPVDFVLVVPSAPSCSRYLTEFT